MLMTLGMERLLCPWSARACASMRATSKGWFQHASAPAHTRPSAQNPASRHRCAISNTRGPIFEAPRSLEGHASGNTSLMNPRCHLDHRSNSLRLSQPCHCHPNAAGATAELLGLAKGELRARVQTCKDAAANATSIAGF